MRNAPALDRRRVTVPRSRRLHPLHFLCGGGLVRLRRAMATPLVRVRTYLNTYTCIHTPETDRHTNAYAYTCVCVYIKFVIREATTTLFVFVFLIKKKYRVFFFKLFFVYFRKK